MDAAESTKKNVGTPYEPKKLIIEVTDIYSNCLTSTCPTDERELEIAVGEKEFVPISCPAKCFCVIFHKLLTFSALFKNQVPCADRDASI